MTESTKYSAWQNVQEIGTLIYAVNMLRNEKIVTLRIAVVHEVPMHNPPDIATPLGDLQKLYPDAVIISVMLETSH